MFPEGTLRGLSRACRAEIIRFPINGLQNRDGLLRVPKP
jgi:hypothetical protein